jgi:hypothetical protein
MAEQESLEKSYCDPKPHKHKHKRKIKIEAVIVCVNYADILAHTLPNNMQHLDQIIVVTDLRDHATRELCKRLGVTCVSTDRFYDGEAVFNKAEGIQVALDLLSRDAWVLHMDADIWLPPHIREVLDSRHLDPECIYGIDRLMCHGYEAWMDFCAKPTPINELYYLVHARAFPIGSRVAHYNQRDGWFPIGFFQLWNPCGSGVHTYPRESGGADHTDVLMSKQFPIGKRHLIAETYVIHIDSEKNKAMGINWKGRKSKPFGPEEKKNGKANNGS